MQSLNPSFDTSFVQAYAWQSPSDAQKALDILASAQGHNPGTTCPVQADGYYDVSKALAANPDTPAPVLEHISDCIGCPKVLERIASNSSSNETTLKRLAQHGSSDVRRAVAENTTLDEETLRRLARDEHIDVRYTLAENHNVPEEVLELLVSDDNPYVATRAEQTKKRLRGADQTGQNADTRQMNVWRKDVRKAV